MSLFLLALLTLARQAGAAGQCAMKADAYAPYLVGGKIGWFDRQAEGRVEPSADAADAIQAGPAQGVLSDVTAYRVAEELAQYAGELDLPASMKVGVAWRKGWDDGPFLELVVADDTGCVTASFDLRSYKPLWVRSAPTAAHIDLLPVDGGYPIEFLQEGCGSPIGELMGSAVRPGGYDFEAGLRKRDLPSMTVGQSGASSFQVAGRTPNGFSFSLYSWDRAPKVALSGDGASFEVPMYLIPPPLAVTPARLIVQCRGEKVDLLYVSGDHVWRFRDIPVEIR